MEDKEPEVVTYSRLQPGEAIQFRKEDRCVGAFTINGVVLYDDEEKPVNDLWQSIVDAANTP